MAKNKQKGKKQQNVFQVANKQSKPKTKAKPVKTSLKHINTLRNEKVESLNQMFTEVQRDVKSISKSTSNESKKDRRWSEKLHGKRSMWMVLHSFSLSSRRTC